MPMVLTFSNPSCDQLGFHREQLDSGQSMTKTAHLQSNMV